jgi:hypothetical protein
MPSQTETGHAVNISNFKLLIDRCAAFGNAYNPSNNDLTIVNMTATWTTVNGYQNDFFLGLQNAKEPINERELMFEGLGAFVTRTIGYFNSTKANKAIKKDVKGLADKIRGHNLEIKKLEDGSPDPDSLSKSHMSFVQRAANFEQLIYLYEANSFFVPNEADLSIIAQKAMLTDLRSANDNMGNVISPVMELRNKRNFGIYAEDTGLIDIAAACKEYVKGLFGTKSPETKSVYSIRFRRLYRL